MNQKRPLQMAMAILGLIPTLTALLGLMGLNDPIYQTAGLPTSALLDSNLRFFNGVWLGLGVAVLWLIPQIEKEVVLYRVLWGMIFLGGVGRLLSIVLVGLPPLPFVGFTVLEIIGAPFFIWWHNQVVAAASGTKSGV